MKGYLYATCPRIAGRLDLLIIGASRFDLRRWHQMVMEALAEAIGVYDFRRAA